MADPGSEVEAPRVDRFLAEITWVCHRHGLSITPGDGGCFLVTEFSQDNLDWLMRANIDLEPGDLS
jgi:hypothetical protein